VGRQSVGTMTESENTEPGEEEIDEAVAESFP
jgi:hypothetical protein